MRNAETVFNMKRFINIYLRPFIYCESKFKLKALRLTTLHHNL